MIKVVVERNKDHTIHSFTMKGHADFAPHGQDLVCAAASAISFGAVNAIHEICGVSLEIDMKGEGGYLRCALPSQLDPSTYEKVQLLLEGMIVSLKTIEEQYGEYIHIKS